MNVPENAGRLTLLEALDIVNASRAQSGPPFPVLLACGFTPLHLATFLHAYLQRSLPARRVHVESGLYGDLIGTLERAAAAAAGTAVVVVIEWADLDRRLGVRHLGGWGTGVRADIIETVQIAADRVGAALEAVARDRHVAVCLPTLSLPPIGHTAGWQAGTFELELQSLITALATRVSRSNGVRIVRRDRLDRLSPIGDRFDVRSELRTGFPYQLHHAAAVAELLAAVIEDRVPKKGLITDLDGTLWSGLIGEVGVDGITWDLDAKSQQHGLYQQFLASLADHGVLIGVASKNDHDLVDKALDRDDLLIERDRIYPVEVSWGAKSAAVERILATWNIGADAVVFVDDSPLELAEVRASHPSIHCLQFESDDPRGVWTLLENLRDLFGKATVSDEDRIRAASLRSGHVAGFGSPATSDDFLSTVQARLTLDFRVDATDARALELVNKTNQFNINGRRYTHAEWAASLAVPGTMLLRVSYEDKFGPLGKIAILGGRKDGDTVRVDTWVMSCRAFSRRIEHQCLERLFQRFDMNTIVCEFRMTERNGPARDFFESVGGIEKDGAMILTRAEFGRHCPRLFHEVTEVGDGS